MKRISFFIICLLILVLPTAIINAGWIDKGSYKELERKIERTYSISYSNDYKYFYTFSHSDDYLRKWDVASGEVLDSFYLEIKKNLEMITFSSDRKYFLIATSYSGNDYPYSYTYLIKKAYNLNEMKLIDTLLIKSASEGRNNWGEYSSGEFNLLKMDYVNGYFISAGTHKSSFSKQGVEKDENSMLDFHIDDSRNRSVFVEFEYHYEDMPYLHQESDAIYFSRLLLADSNLKNEQTILEYVRNYVNNSDFRPNSPSTPEYYKIDKALINKNDNFVYFTSSDNTVRTYDYINEVFLRNYYWNFDYNTAFEFSEDDRFLFLTYQNQLRILHPQTKDFVKDIFFDSTLNSFSFNPSTYSLISIRQPNTIELRDLSDVAEKIDFFASDTLSYPNKEITFYYSGPESYTNFTWEFGDGESGEGKIVKHAYKSKNTYSVNLIVSDDSDNKAAVNKNSYITIVDSIKADFIVLYIDPDDYHYYVFKNISKGEVVKVKWNFGDGKYDSTYNAGHKFENDGLYIVKLEVEDASQTKSFKELLIYVYPIPASISEDYKEQSTTFNFSPSLEAWEDLQGLEFEKIIAKNDKFYGIISLLVYDQWDEDVSSTRSFIILNNKFEKTQAYLGYKDFTLINHNKTDKVVLISNRQYCVATPEGEILFTNNSSSSEYYHYADESGNIYSLAKDKSNKNYIVRSDLYHKQIETIDSYDFKYYDLIHCSETTDDVIINRAGGSYSDLRTWAKVSKHKSLMDTMSYSMNGLLKMIGLKSNSIITFLLSSNTGITEICKSNAENNIEKSIPVNLPFAKPKIIKLRENLFAVTGQNSFIPGYILIDSNLNIIYYRFFKNYKRNIETLTLYNDSLIVLLSSSWPDKENDSTFNLYYIVDTLPREFVDDIIVTSKVLQTEKNTIQVYPNPATNNVEFILPKDTLMGTFEIYNMQSQKVFTKSNVVRNVNLNLQIFPPGVYFCVFKSVGKVISRKFMIVR